MTTSPSCVSQFEITACLIQAISKFLALLLFIKVYTGPFHICSPCTARGVRGLNRILSKLRSEFFVRAVVISSVIVELGTVRGSSVYAHVLIRKFSY